jgi:co-chaperonin GroES (HSP10)
MKIHPLNNIIQLKMEGMKAGALQLNSMDTAIEYAEVIDFGDKVEGFKKGDKVFVKAWAIDIVTYQNEKYYFCNTNTEGILAKIR